MSKHFEAALVSQNDLPETHIIRIANRILTRLMRYSGGDLKLKSLAPGISEKILLKLICIPNFQSLCAKDKQRVAILIEQGLSYDMAKKMLAAVIRETPPRFKPFQSILIRRR
jgi:hypothetical protein